MDLLRLAQSFGMGARRLAELAITLRRLATVLEEERARFHRYVKATRDYATTFDVRVRRIEPVHDTADPGPGEARDLPFGGHIVIVVRRPRRAPRSATDG